MQLLFHMLQSKFKDVAAMSMARHKQSLIKVGFEKDLELAPFFNF